MVLCDKRTLVVRHIPSELSTVDKTDFLQFFGAREVICLSSKNAKASPVFAKFASEPEAEAALRKLHQVEIFDQLLSVEFARGSDLKRHLPPQNNRENEIREEQSTKKKYLDNFIQKLNSWTNQLDFSGPPPIHLKYQYPPPSLQVLTNIAKVLATDPKFYTQVLHLMNKMNLPCPFSEKFSVETELIPSGLTQVVVTTEKSSKSSEEESEMESDEEALPNKESNVFPVKRKLAKTIKVVKKPKLLKVPVAPPSKPKVTVKTEDVFETERKEVPRKIEVKVSGDLKHLQEEKVEILEEGFEKVILIKEKEEIKSPEEGERAEEDKSFITAEELAANRISSKDQHVLQVFKNYQPGVASCRLYIKNLAKTVTKDDLGYIFRRYVLPIQEEQGTMFDIQLLQEGRMKGQAFVSLQSIRQAKLALSETNGYVLKGKPMVVQYARSSKVK